MSAETWWIVGCVVFGVIGLWLVMRGRRRPDVIDSDPRQVMHRVTPVATPPMPTKPTATELTPLDHHVRKLAAEGNKIEAIKAVREHTGLGLKEAKDYVDAIPNVVPLANFGHAPARREGPMDEAMVRRAAGDLIAKGQKIEAIKLIRENTDWDLKRAKEYADAIEQAPVPSAVHALFVDASVSEIFADSPMVRRAVERAYEKACRRTPSRR